MADTYTVERALVVDAPASRMNYTLKFDEESLVHLNKHNEIYGRYK